MSAIAGSVMPDAEHVISFHMLLAGRCFAEIVGTDLPPVRLEPGDVVIFPRGDPNVVTSTPGLRDTPDLANYYRPLDRQLPFVPNRAQRGQPGEVRFVCGYFGCDARPFNPLLDALPRLLHYPGGPRRLARAGDPPRRRGERGSSHRRRDRARQGERAPLRRGRARLYRLPAEGTPGWLAGLRDPQLSAALRLIHARPADDWSLDRLAREAGLPLRLRRPLQRHLLGTSPMNYLGRWRMQLAAGRLELPGISIAQAGAEVGYESEAAFNRAFKKYVGMPPGSWRRRHRITDVANGAVSRTH